MTRANRETRPTRTDRDARANRDDPITDREPATMGEVSHTHPYGDRGAIDRPFQRGPVVVADGGRRGARDEDEQADDGARDEESREAADAEDADSTRMKDVDHTPPYGDGEEVDRVFERGGTEEPVESEE